MRMSERAPRTNSEESPWLPRWRIWRRRPWWRRLWNAGGWRWRSAPGPAGRSSCAVREPPNRASAPKRHSFISISIFLRKSTFFLNEFIHYPCYFYWHSILFTWGFGKNRWVPASTILCKYLHSRHHISQLVLKKVPILTSLRLS